MALPVRIALLLTFLSVITSMASGASAAAEPNYMNTCINASYAFCNATLPADVRAAEDRKSVV